MAHHVAELIDDAGKARGKTKALANHRCRVAILDLWAHRTALSDRRLTADLDPILATLERLASPSGRHNHNVIWQARDDDGGAPANPETKKWLDLAREADCAARDLVGWALATAAAATGDRSLEWVKLARKAGADDDSLARITVLLRNLRPEFAPPAVDVDPRIARSRALKNAVRAINILAKELNAASEAEGSDGIRSEPTASIN